LDELCCVKDKETELRKKATEVEAGIAALRAKEVDWQRRKNEAEDGTTISSCPQLVFALVFALPEMLCHRK